MVGLSSSANPDWNDMMFLAKLIPRILQNVNRVCYIFGDEVKHQVTDISHTYLSLFVLSQIRHADHIVNEVRKELLNKALADLDPNLSVFSRFFIKQILCETFHKCRSS